MDILKAAGIGKEIKLAGKMYTLMPTKLRHIAEYAGWLNNQLHNPLPLVVEALFGPHASGLTEAERRELLLKAYGDSYGPARPFEDPLFAGLRSSVEGQCYELWLSLKQCHADEFPSHLEVMDLVGESVGDLTAATVALAKLNDPDPNPLKNGRGQPTEETSPRLA